LELQERLDGIHSRIEAACKRSGRSPEDVTIIAVTKYTTLEVAEEALAAGLRHIGENRWQDVKPKWEAIGERAVWHFIGSLQTNKVKDVVGRFAYIHSLDRSVLAEELERKAAARGETVQCFIQVNVSGEETKHGLPPEELEDFIVRLRDMPHIRVAGLMTMAPYDSEGEASRPVFRRLRELRDELNLKQLLPYPVKELSMGMSGDFEAAVEEGATYIRLGTVLVGRS
jgi:PLP dependent protein